MDFLATEHWMDVGLQHPDSININENHFALSTFPGSSSCMWFCYTFYMARQSITNNCPTNLLVRRQSNGLVVWKGDVLVVKSKLESPDLVINMEQGDMELVNLVLWR